MARNNMTVCKSCGSEIARSAKACPVCGAKNKKPIYRRAWFIILMIIVVLGIIGTTVGGGDDSPSTDADQTADQVQAEDAADTQDQTKAKAKKETEATIEYTEVSADQMMDDLDANAAVAKDTYEGKYVAVSGKLGNIDSDGKYIDIMPDDEFAFLGVQCYVQNDDQLDRIKSKSKGDRITVKGKVTSVGEIIGYALDIDKIE